MVESLSQVDHSLPERDAIDPLFLLDATAALDVADGCEPSLAAEFLDREVARAPGQLTRHVQRVLLHVRTRNVELLPAALIDAFIALGPVGAPLKRRLLAHALPLLESTQRRWLEAALRTGVSREDPRAAVSGSMLSRCVIGRLDYIERCESVRDRRSPVAEARALLEEGDIENAQSLLEAVLAESEDEIEIRDELRGIYLATRNYAALERMDRSASGWVSNE